MQTPNELCPHVRQTNDRNVFEVKSRSEEKWRRVDGEARAGLMQCDCPDYTMNKNRDCYHIAQVRKLVSVAAMQSWLRQKSE